MRVLDKKSEFDKIFKSLKESFLFSKVEDEILKLIIKECEYIGWEKGENIPPDIGNKKCFFIVEGRMKITQIDPKSGRSVALFLLKNGDVFDIFTLLDGKEHTVFPVPIDNMKLLSISLERAREWLRMYPKFNETFLPYLGNMLRELESFSESLIFHDTATRLANLILRHTLKCKDENDGIYPVKLINNLSHESLAELIGSVRSVVTQQLKKLKEEEILISKKGKMAIKNLEKLIKKCDLFGSIKDKK
ncbi:MAG: Crp/Fnr family transcriptional regulator [Epsilonproteobacteria bacterium]|nr:Crp/Fnr family transcriptional regulator [Campylobacterota bacterium]